MSWFLFLQLYDGHPWRRDTGNQNINVFSYNILMFYSCIVLTTRNLKLSSATKFVTEQLLAVNYILTTSFTTQLTGSYIGLLTAKK